VTLILDLDIDLDSVEMNLLARYVGHIIQFKLLTGHTDTNRTNCYTWTTKADW